MNDPVHISEILKPIMERLERGQSPLVEEIPHTELDGYADEFNIEWQDGKVTQSQSDR